MISIALGFFVVLAAISLLVSTKAVYIDQDEGARIQETGRYAIETIARSVRQAAYENWDSTEAPIVATSAVSANIAGLDAHSLNARTEGLGSPLAASINGSDVLAIRFFGSGRGSTGDETMLNCAGVGVPAPTSPESADMERGWSIFYVSRDSSGEYELYCKFRAIEDEGADGQPRWTAQSIARGVESFQVLYGLDTDADGLPNQFMTATAINALDEGLVIPGDSDAVRNTQRNAKTHWKKVVVVKVALLLRGSEIVQSNALNAQYDLFGEEYGDAHATSDPGSRIREPDLPADSRNRIRRIFASTIQVRNQVAGSST